MPGAREKCNKKAQTVLGLVDGGDLGITLPHEHLLIDMAVWFMEPKEAELVKLAYAPVSLENISWIMYNQYNNLDNLKLLDADMAARELMLFKKEGGKTIVDVTTANLGRDPLALARLSRTTDLHVVMGSGYYVGAAQDQDIDRKSEEEIGEEIAKDIQDGVDGTGVKAGIIGEIGCSWPLQGGEKKILRACARAQNVTGAAITIHPGRHEDSPMEIISVLSEAGADVSRVIMGHIDRTGFLLETIRKLAKTGCYLQYDIFGGNPFYPLHFGLFNRPCDRERIEQIQILMHEGYIEQILMSQDTCLKSKLVCYGGQGYGHILRNIVPQMLARGVTKEQIRLMMVENPKRVLAFV
ncbi:MAG: aryldialkylphosphatase [Deltaproteobacteria bacterium]|nr:aryldialkylphosphatase [Deltaproteobacteria bacterium]